MRNRCLKFLLIACLSLFLAGCGTISSLKLKVIDPTLFKTRYSNVMVKQFGSATVKTDLSESEIALARTRFADMIAEEIRSTSAFSDVSRDKEPGESTLVIGGDILNYTEGDAALRLLLGCGAGSSYFKALVRFYDGNNKDEIGTITVDNNSWVLGGMCAAGQTPETFMRGAAKKVASETKKLAK